MQLRIGVQLVSDLQIHSTAGILASGIQAVDKQFHKPRAYLIRRVFHNRQRSDGKFEDRGGKDRQTFEVFIFIMLAYCVFTFVISFVAKAIDRRISITL